MPDIENTDPSPTDGSRRPESKTRWGLRIGLGAAAVVLLAIVYLVVRLFLPVWWATNIGNQTQGSLTSGIILGLVYGFVFTFVPLLVVWQARYKKVSWPWKSVIVVVAVLLAIPNLLTLSIYANSSSAAAKARSMIDISATWFPSWSIGGAVAALVLFVGIAAFWHLWRARGKKMKALKSEVKSQGAMRDAAEQKRDDRPAPATESGQTAPQTPVWAPREDSEDPTKSSS